MSTFFFYNNLINTELIKKINNQYTIEDGYIIVESYNDSCLKIGEKNVNKNTLLKGKIVQFNITLQDVLEKINDIPECKNEKKDKYTVEKVWATRHNGGHSETYIIY